MIDFRIVDTSEIGRAHAWHLGFAAANDAIFPRSERSFFDLALDRHIWCAITDTDDILGMAYSHVADDNGEIEIGGLMVATRARGKGIGDVLMRLPLCHLLVEERPLRWQPQPRIVAHVLAGNDLPRAIVTRTGFAHPEPICVPGHKLPGLRTASDGNVHGDEFRLDLPDALTGLAAWLDGWRGELRDGTAARIILLEDETLADWAIVLRSMV